MKNNEFTVSRIILAFCFAYIGFVVIDSSRLPFFVKPTWGKFYIEEYKYIIGGFFLIVAIFLIYRALVKS